MLGDTIAMSPSASTYLCWPRHCCCKQGKGEKRIRDRCPNTLYRGV